MHPSTHPTATTTPLAALSDADLDRIAGSGTGQQVLNSVLSLGFGCIVASLTALGAQRDCGAEIETLFKGDIPPRDGTFRF